MTELEQEILARLLIDLFLAKPRNKQEVNGYQNTSIIETVAQTDSTDALASPVRSKLRTHEQVDHVSFGTKSPELEKKMITVAAISELPNAPAVYTLYGGQGKGMYVAYVGSARQLKTRIIQHLVRRDSSVTTGVQAVSLNPDYVTKVGWWEHTDFVDPSKLAAAELVAFDILDPALRSRGTISEQAKHFYTDKVFNSEKEELFRGEVSGYLIVPTLQAAFERILTLENCIAELTQRICKLEQGLEER